jgi:putative pyruvate formate lyase activating enzyme
MAVLRHIASILPPADVRVSVMRQYTPDFAMDCPNKNLHRRVTEFEYRSVLDEAERLGLEGFSQGKDAASKVFTPDFASEGTTV